MTRLRVGFDWDDVIAPWYYPAHEACAEFGLGRAPYVTPITWTPHEEYGVSLARWKGMLQLAAQSGWIYQEPPYEEAIWAMRSLWWNHPDDVEIVIATARADFPVMPKEWLKKTVTDAIEEYAIPVHELIFTSDKREANCDWFLDDRIPHYEQLEAAGTVAVLKNQTWNHHLDPFLLRVDTVTEYVEMIEETL